MSARLLRIAREALAKRAGAAEQEGAEAGFTLIELMVVLLIMAILLAIAIPTFLGVKGGAQDRAAQSNLSNALISAKSIYATNSSYLVATSMATTLNAQEPELVFATGTAVTTNTNSISVNVGSGGGQLVLVDYSSANGGSCWAVSDWDGTNAATEIGGTTFPGQGTTYSGWKIPAGGCSAAAIPTTATFGSKYPAAVS
ncbi:MAG TPA: type II secretion system protein [Acidimicrobiales bacterium]